MSSISSGISTIQHFSQILELPPTKGVPLYAIDADECAFEGAFGFEGYSGLGDPAWRLWCKSALNQLNELKSEIEANIDNFDLFSSLSLYAAVHADYRAVGDSAQTIKAIQDAGHPAFILTARGSRQWYSVTLESEVIRSLTRKQFAAMGITFEKNVPVEMKSITVPVNVKYLNGRVTTDNVSIADGLMFTSNSSKLDFIVNAINASGFNPSRIVFIDDKKNAVEEVEKAVKKLNEGRVKKIDFVGYHLQRPVERLDAVVTNIQLERLLFNEEIITGKAAVDAANAMKEELANEGVQAEQFGIESLKRLLERIKSDPEAMKKLNPNHSTIY